MRIDYNVKDKFDFWIIGSIITLITFGLLAIYSSTLNHPTAYGNFERQLYWAVGSFVILFIIIFLPKQILRLSVLPSYLISIAMLLAVLFAGKTVYGAKSWLSFGPFGFQPSEFAKIGLILSIAYWFGNRQRDINSIKDIGLALIIGCIPIILILLEPDMGTAIVFIVVTLTMIFWAGISLFSVFIVLSPGFVAFSSLFGTVYFLLSLVIVAGMLFFFKRDLFLSITIFVINISAGFLFDFLFKILKPHQQKRIESFLDPAADPLGSGYNAMQAKVAIGSGGLFGKGFLHGNQTQLRFIPEQWTDFIYCVIGEEFGFLGGITVLILFLVIFIRLLHILSQVKDAFYSLIIVGILTLLFTHFAINIGMNVGLIPVIGLPLPFLSYGGSSLLQNMIFIGIVLNIYKNRKQNV